jgi:hypothetical protein
MAKYGKCATDQDNFVNSLIFFGTCAKVWFCPVVAMTETNYIPMKKQQFPQFLKYLLDTERYKLGDIAQSSKVHVSDLSKIVGGKRNCGAKLIGHILEGLDPKDRADALVYWLKDQIPAGYASGVVVQKAEDASQAKPVASMFDDTLCFLAEEAQTNEAVRNLLVATAQLFRKSP